MVHFTTDAALATVLDPPDIDRALTGLLRAAADRLHLSGTRQQALVGASILVTGETGDGLGSRRLAEVFDLACGYARGEHDGSAMDDLLGSRHPLSSLRIDMGETSLAGQGLYLAARATRGDEQRSAVLDLASAIIGRQPGEPVLHDAATSLVALGSLAEAPASLSIATLAQSPSQSLRAVAAIYWVKSCGDSDPPVDFAVTGIELARDPSPVVRRTLAGRLAPG
jgi:hypothetical protein